jgi:hypothetical protein
MKKSALFNDREVARHIHAGFSLDRNSKIVCVSYFILFSFLLLGRQDGILSLSGFFIFYTSIYVCNLLNKSVDDKDFFYRYLFMCSVSAFYGSVICFVLLSVALLFKINYGIEFINDYSDFVTLSILSLFSMRSIRTFQYFCSLYDVPEKL